MEAKEIEALIRYHRDGLAQYRQHMSPAAQYLKEQTIKALEELKSEDTTRTKPEDDSVLNRAIR
ncbi:hypothetical protein ES708_17221 [subsurface metagenome]